MLVLIVQILSVSLNGYFAFNHLKPSD